SNSARLFIHTWFTRPLLLIHRSCWGHGLARMAIARGILLEPCDKILVHFGHALAHHCFQDLLGCTVMIDICDQVLLSHREIHVMELVLRCKIAYKDRCQGLNGS